VTRGTIERLDPRFDALVPPNAAIEVLASGFDWAEGPVWVEEDGGYLLFSDVPRNVVHRWDEAHGLSIWLRPSGYTGNIPRGGEPGSNGLTLDAGGHLILAQHGDRRIARLDTTGWSYVTVADRFEGKRFNSPNDVVVDRAGNVYFTDPIYGLPKHENDPTRELDFCGVFRVTPEGRVSLLTKELSRPNGIALSPDERTLYLNNSDSERAVCMAYPLASDGTLGPGRVFFDRTSEMGKKPGSPDGLKVDREGNVFSSGPGGILVFAPDGTHLGTIATGVATANCAFGGADGSTLYLAADGELLRVR
jgi:gluconolactonase